MSRKSISAGVGASLMMAVVAVSVPFAAGEAQVLPGAVDVNVIRPDNSRMKVFWVYARAQPPHGNFLSELENNLSDRSLDRPGYIGTQAVGSENRHSWRFGGGFRRWVGLPASGGTLYLDLGIAPANCIPEDDIREIRDNALGSTNEYSKVLGAGIVLGHLAAICHPGTAMHKARLAYCAVRSVYANWNRNRQQLLQLQYLSPPPRRIDFNCRDFQ